jgi:Glycosyltransferase (GlcNAc)
MRRRRGLDEDGGGGGRDHTGSTTSRNGIKGTTKVVLPRSRKQWISIINCVGVLLSILYVILALASTTFLGRHNPRYWMEHLRRPRQHMADVHAIRRLQHQFPVHTGVSSGDEDWETIPHPGFAMADPERLQVILADLPLTNDNEESLQERTQKLQNLKVPKFWNPKEFSPDGGVRNYLGQGGTYVLSKEEAESIGSFYTDPYPPTTNHHATTTDDSDNDDGGEEEDRNRHRPHHKGTMETIFVALASYRDPECLPTLQDLYQRAKYPERIRVGIVDQRVPSDGDDTVVQMNKVPAPRDKTTTNRTKRWISRVLHRVPRIPIISCATTIISLMSWTFPLLSWWDRHSHDIWPIACIGESILCYKSILMYDLFKTGTNESFNNGRQHGMKWRSSLPTWPM